MPNSDIGDLWRLIVAKKKTKKTATKRPRRTDLQRRIRRLASATAGLWIQAKDLDRQVAALMAEHGD